MQALMRMGAAGRWNLVQRRKQGMTVEHDARIAFSDPARDRQPQ